MTLDAIQINFLEDQRKVLNFCVEQLIIANEENVSETKKHPYSIIALFAIDNIVQLIEESNKK